ncbi:MAG: CehA/McbA family metallohydrolase [Verrucomicrobiota bacterium]
MRNTVFALGVLMLSGVPAGAGELRGTVIDLATGKAVAARVYVEGADGEFYHVEAASEDGEAVPYEKKRGEGSVEVHTCVSAHPFVVELPAGEYEITVERGKEYFPTVARVTLGDGSMTAQLPLQRWIDMGERGWFSGDTHVHRTMAELPTVIMAEDLNVALPLTAWVTDSEHRPTTDNKSPVLVPPARLIEVDGTHVIWPVNTEYEIFSVAGERHVLGAIFVLHHREAFDLSVPPVGPLAAAARAQGAVLDLDKHNWPWSVMLLPVMDVDLFELTNNHIWRTEFMFSDWNAEYADAELFGLEMNETGGFTEEAWIRFGMQMYYAVLSCGFRMAPSAGTASGVHPVPLGFGRVYVHLEDGFDFERWMEGLKAGRSFVTTGPMLEVEFLGEQAGHVFEGGVGGVVEVPVAGQLLAANVRDYRIEVIVNGTVREVMEGEVQGLGDGEHAVMQERFTVPVAVAESSWIALAAYVHDAEGRLRFAHTGPVYVDVAGKPLRAKRAEVAYFVKRLEDEIARHEGVLSAAALGEYEEALGYFRGLMEGAR